MKTDFLTEFQWRTVFVVAGVGVSFLMLQTDVPIEGWAKVTLGLINAILIALSPTRLAGPNNAG
jgi:hypothetical protein